MSHKIYAVGLGPGCPAMLSPRAKEVLENCDTIAGYRSYLEQIPDLIENKQIIASGMRQELDRCRAALSENAPKRESFGSMIRRACSTLRTIGKQRP